MKRFLNLGCGPIHIPSINGHVEWINIDIAPEHKPDICEDYLKLATLFRESTIDGIISVHSIEHLEYPAGVVKFFQACFKVLQPGGTLRIVVPDLRKICRAYLHGSDMTFIHGPEFRAYYHKAESPAERVHWFVSGRWWQHQICFDSDLLDLLATDAGFVNFRVCQFGQSRIPEFCGIDRFESESVCVEADKPTV